ncbi:MAG: OmpA family protein [Spirochaetia bacterium]
MKKIGVFVFLSFVCCSSFGEEFRFQYQEGSQYRILAEVDEDVYINGGYSHSAQILNRIAIRILQTRDDNGLIHGEFQISEEAQGSGQIYTWGNVYESEFWRGPRGEYEIDEHYFMPVVRNVPRFPERSVEPGDTWVFQAEEVHDFRNNFQISAPYRVPVTVTYTYQGNEEVDGREMGVIEMSYNVFHRTSLRGVRNTLFPVRMSGASRQTMYWDFENGRPHSYTEDFEFILELASGDEVEYVGTASAEVIASEPLELESVAEDIQQRLDEGGVEDTTVEEDDEGVTISLENIRFRPDSAELLESEIEKLRQIANILEEYPERDILITGHAARLGSEEYLVELSRLRAQAVAEQLHEWGVRERTHMYTQGLGSSQPIADNSTEEGRRRNRRVTITILNN